MSDWHVGQKIVCVNAGEWRQQISDGAIYTIHSINSECGLWLRLVEVFPEKGGFASVRFRPLITQSKGMTRIREIVADPSKPIPADPREPVHIPSDIERAGAGGIK